MTNQIAPRVVTGKLLSPVKTPGEAIADLRNYFDELAKQQDFINTAWCKHYSWGLDIKNPVNAKMYSAMEQVNIMVYLVEKNIRALERNLNTSHSALREIAHDQ